VKAKYAERLPHSCRLAKVWEEVRWAPGGGEIGVASLVTWSPHHMRADSFKKSRPAGLTSMHGNMYRTRSVPARMTEWSQSVESALSPTSRSQLKWGNLQPTPAATSDGSERKFWRGSFTMAAVFAIFQQATMDAIGHEIAINEDVIPDKGSVELALDSLLSTAISGNLFLFLCRQLGKITLSVVAHKTIAAGLTGAFMAVGDAPHMIGIH